ncbi:MAG: T9SS type A sorting domain-containing protein [Candidatus Cloacimonetes bacterium]|nr:T9SS type A sorting domain-containing protein [Candidatus Cloacimonadota bacterium]
MTPDLVDYIPQEDTLYVIAGEQMAFGLVCNDEEVTYSWFVDSELQGSTSFVFNLVLTTNGWHEVTGVVSNENYDLPKAWWVFVTGGTDADDEIIVNRSILYQNEPNPFNPETKIRFHLQEPEFITLKIYNLKGQLVKTLADKYFEGGEHSIIWQGKNDQGKDPGSGIYIYHLKSKQTSEMRKAILLK